MGYTKLGIINRALGRIGVKRIASLTENSQQCIDAIAVWDDVLFEVLEEREWKFAKTRATLEMRYENPHYGYPYAYVLPGDFLRMARKDKNTIDAYDDYYSVIDETIYPYVIETLPLPNGLEKVANGGFAGSAIGWNLGTGWAYGTNNVYKISGNVNTLSQAYGDMETPPIVGELYRLQIEIVSISGGSIIPTMGGVTGTPISTTGVKTQDLIAESATDGITIIPSSSLLTCYLDNISLVKLEDKKCILTHYDDSEINLHLPYIKYVKDPSSYPGSFVNALVFRLAAELSVMRTESQTKYTTMMGLYDKALIRADEINQSLDYLEGEDGNLDWEDAGR